VCNELGINWKEKDKFDDGGLLGSLGYFTLVPHHHPFLFFSLVGLVVLVQSRVQTRLKRVEV